jgi:signal transduction histidine kinase
VLQQVSKPSSARPTVVVIDDSRAELLAMEGLVGSLGYDILLADNAEDGLRHAFADEVALIIADVRMPRVDGLEMLARLRERAQARKTPVVFMSGYGYDSQQARRAYELGAVDYIVKPIDPDILRAKIAALVTLFEQAREIEHRDAALRTSERKAQTAHAVASAASVQVARAEDSLREKDRYIGVLGHDLRNPLAAIVVGLNLLTKSQNLSDAEKRQLARTLRSAQRMTVMIRDLLEYTRASVGEFPHSPVPMDLHAVCNAAVEELRVVHPDRTIVCDVAGNVEGTWDPDRLQQVVSNLVGNALEHSDGVVSVRVEAAEHDVVLSVHNDGEPIPAEVLPALFEPFRRGERSAGGLGLGLYIVREVIRRHGGRIDVRSSSAAGTTFVSRWPRVQAASAANDEPCPPDVFASNPAP